jgi:putative nucleotidyltransferase with HDIG domain
MAKPKLRKRKPELKQRLRSLVPRPAYLALWLCTSLLLALVMTFHLLPDRVMLQVGDRVPTDIRAPRSVQFIDTDATERMRESAAARVRSVYDPDPNVPAWSSRYIAEVFDRLRKARTDNSLQNLPRRRERAITETAGILTPEQARYLVSAPDSVLDRLEASAHRLVEAVMDSDIRTDTDDLAQAVARLEKSAATQTSSPEEAAVLAAVGKQAVRPNLVLNRRKTEALREQARRQVGQVTGDIRIGDVVARSGEIFTTLHLDKCQALGLINPRVDVITAFSIWGLCALFSLFVGIWAKTARPRIYAEFRHLLLVAGIGLLCITGLKLFGAALGLPSRGLQVEYVGVAIAVAGAMSIAFLLDIGLSVLVAAVVSVLAGIILNNELRFTVITLVGSLAGIFGAMQIKDRSQLLRAGGLLLAANVAITCLLGGLMGDTLHEVGYGLFWSACSAILAVLVFWFAVAALEKPFGILTNVWLMELGASERPLLRQLCLTAPGTYAHSIMVGNLAETAAEAIGADALFCRVASYYHDIGKMKRPHCFVENQMGDNVHARLNPSLSALIIAAHVRDGLDLARAHHLPEKLQDVIREHHGTSLIRYFYHQALSGSETPDPVLEQHFRYEGPKPQTRESGIILLADSVEAAVRALDKPTRARIQGRVETIVQDKLADGQLDECDLTLRDLRIITDAFVRLLTAMHHGRVEYPTSAAVPPLAGVTVPPDADTHPESADAPDQP